jgi:hypothetical protein
VAQAVAEYMAARPVDVPLPSMVEALAAAGVREGIWTGAPCYIVGGGPSLKGFDFTKLRGHRVIAVNRAFEFVENPALFVTLDDRYIRGVVGGAYGGEVAERFAALDCPKLVVQSSTTEPLPPGVLALPRGGEIGGIADSFKAGLWSGKNSGFVALQVALLLGASEVNLLGFDMTPGWHHEGHPWPTDPGVYAIFANAFDAVAEKVQRRAVVRNLSPESGLTCFPRYRLDVPASKAPLFASFHTPDDIYRRHAARLRRSLILQGIPHVVEEIPAIGDWVANTHIKATFLQRMHANHGGPLVWTDADSTVELPPLLFDGLRNVDLALHKLRGKEMLAGTLYLGAGKRVSQMLKAWVEECEAGPTTWDQHALQRIIGRCAVRGLRVADLPAAYCTIFDTMKADLHGEPPVIQHWQASREARKNEPCRAQSSH